MVNVSSIESQLSKLTSLIQSLIIRKIKQAKAYEICTNPNHLTGMCPMLQEDDQHINAMNIFPIPP